MSLHEGFIRNTRTKSGVGKRPPYRPWTKYDADLYPANGGEPLAINFGFEKPPVSEGDYVELEISVNGKFNEVDIASIRKKDPPKQAESVAEASTNAAGGGTVQTFGEFNRQTHPEDARRITYASALSHAVQTVSLLIDANALPMSKAQDKGGTAKRFNEITQAIDKLTVKYFNDQLSLRLLETVADTVIDSSASSELPKDSQGSGDGGVDD